MIRDILKIIVAAALLVILILGVIEELKTGKPCIEIGVMEVIGIWVMLNWIEKIAQKIESMGNN